METTALSTRQFVIRITDVSLSFALRKEDRSVDYEEYGVKREMSAATNLRDFFRSSRLLRGAGMKAVVAVDSPVLLVPINDYDENRIKQQYNYVYPDMGKKLLQSSVLPFFKTMAVFAVDRDLNTVLSDNFDEVRIEPLMARFWDYMSRRNERGNAKKLYVYFHEGKVEICSFIHCRFVFANTFTAGDYSDAVYFILGAWQQINADGMKDEIVLSGKIPGMEELSRDLRRFVRRVYFINPLAEAGGAQFLHADDMPFDMMMQFV